MTELDLRTLVQALAESGTARGDALAARFGVTRAAVWKRIERLRALGLPIAARAGEGYRLERQPDWLDAGAIRSSIASGTRVGALEVHVELDSTSSEWLRRGASLPDASVCLAEVQTGGRGRRGRRWRMPLAAGIAMSVLWRFDQGLSALQGLSLAVGAAVRDALVHAIGASVGLKWPNDLWWQGRKLGGVLIEASGESTGPCTVVIGLGLNHDLPAQAMEGLDQPWTDLATLARATSRPLPRRNDVVAIVLDHLLPELERFEAEGLEPVLARWREGDVLAGRLATVETAGRRHEARIEGIDGSGRLLARFDGRLQALSSAEVSVRTVP